MTAPDFLAVDLPALVTTILAALSCGLIGNFLVLRRQALMGDAFSHVVFPGIVAGYLIAGVLAPLPILLGATAAAVIAAILIEVIHRAGRIEPGAAMGVVLTVMFAAGIVALEQSGASNVHLDAEHALFGNLEATLWLGVSGWSDLLDPSVLATLPRQIVLLAVIAFCIALGIAVFFKEISIMTFDPGLAALLGLPVRTASLVLVSVTAVAAVAAFEAVGSILVIAMFVCPVATARLLTDRLFPQLWISAAAAVIAGLTGYGAAAFGPRLWGSSDSLSAAGMIAVTAGLLQVVAMIVTSNSLRRKKALDAPPRHRVR